MTRGSWILFVGALGVEAAGCDGQVYVGTIASADDGGCSQTAQGGCAANGPDAGGSSGGSASSSGAGTGSASSSGAGTEAGVGDGGSGVQWGAPIPAADLGNDVTLRMTSFTAAAGSEGYLCQVFDNPFGGVSTDIVQSHGVVSAGVHRFILDNMPPEVLATYPAVGSPGSCPGYGLELHPFVFFAQQPDWTVAYPAAPDGSPMGYPLAGGHSVMMYVHYLNVGSTPMTVDAQITLTPARPGVVTTHAGSLFLEPTTISVPPGTTPQSPAVTTTTWNGDPALPARYDIITSWSFMTHWGLRLTATVGGARFYTESSWNEPGLFVHAANVTEPPTASGTLAPIPMTRSTPITWSCSFYNDTSQTLSWGDGALTNAWCNYVGQYYPADPSSPDIVAIVN